jgi:alpha-glucan,water dikinase
MPTDVLSHVAIRARAQTVLLSSCFDSQTLEHFKEFGNEAMVKVAIDGAGCISMNIANKDDYVSASSTTELPMQKKFKNLKIKSNGSWILEESEFENLKVGGKALHLSELHGMLASTDLKSQVAIPVSLALPYGTLDKVLQDKVNKKTKKAVSDLEGSLAGKESSPGIPEELASLRQVVSDAIVAPADLFKELSSKARSANLIAENEWKSIDCPSWKATWAAICQVWASSWNDRAWLSRKSMGIPQTSFHMSVLLQQIVPARYAFVLHTADPLTGESGNIHGELVIGLGEALVGNFPGRALSFTFDTATSTPQVHTFPSKVAGIFPASSQQQQSLLIARSDSNAEDLEDFAGAGLYSSIPAQSYASHPIRYAEEEILWNPTHRESILKQIGTIGMQIEAVCNSPQDIEGVVDAQGNITIVQTRPQVIAASVSD